jgi:clan AA aspartic protease
VIDTGFTDYVTLPREIVNTLGLRYSQSMDFELADGEVAMFDLYECELLWNGVHRQVLVTVTEGGSLLGMSLLDGHRLVMDVVAGGVVTIDPLP